MSSLKGAERLSALLHEPCAPDLANIHAGGNSIAFSSTGLNFGWSASLVVRLAGLWQVQLMGYCQPKK